MSIPVDVTALGRVVAAYSAGYLITVGPDGAPKVVTVEPSVLAGVVVVPVPGKGSRANAAAHPAVTLVFPPREEKGFTLLVDGTGAVDGDDLRIEPTSAVLHRPATHSDGPPAPVSVGASDCANDCSHI
jgi:hypothetical protein